MAKSYGTIRDVSEMLNIQPDTVWRWVESGYLPAIRLGRSTGSTRRRHTLRFDLDMVQKWVEGQAAYAAQREML